MPFSKKRYRETTEPDEEAKSYTTRAAADRYFRTSGVSSYQSAENDAAVYNKAAEQGQGVDHRNKKTRKKAQAVRLSYDYRQTATSRLECQSQACSEDMAKRGLTSALQAKIQKGPGHFRE